MLTWSMMSALLLLPLTLASVRAICLAMFYLECTGFVAILAGEACSAVEIVEAFLAGPVSPAGGRSPCMPRGTPPLCSYPS